MRCTTSTATTEHETNAQALLGGIFLDLFPGCLCGSYNKKQRRDQWPATAFDTRST